MPGTSPFCKRPGPEISPGTGADGAGPGPLRGSKADPGPVRAGFFAESRTVAGTGGRREPSIPGRRRAGAWPGRALAGTAAPASGGGPAPPGRVTCPALPGAGAPAKGRGRCGPQGPEETMVHRDKGGS